MINKGKWVLLPASALLDKYNMCLSPLDVVPQRYCRPRTICDYSLFLIKDDTIELCPEESMQFGRALIARSDPRLGPVFLSKIDIVYGVYRIGIRVDDVPTLGIISPTQPERNLGSDPP
jgi:hypothetical protein